MNNFEKIRPRSEPERAKALHECEDPLALDKQRQFILRMLSQPMSCPLCAEKCSYYVAADEDIAIEDAYTGPCHCPHCGIGLSKTIPLVKTSGPGWYWMISEDSRKHLVELWFKHGAEKPEVQV